MNVLLGSKIRNLKEQNLEKRPHPDLANRDKMLV